MKNRVIDTYVEVQKALRFLSSKSKALAARRRQEVANGRPLTRFETERILVGCIDCGTSPSGMDYMVHDTLWASAGLNKKNLCCEECLSRRLGRSLTIADYTQTLCNQQIFRGYQMALVSQMKEENPNEIRP